MSLDNNNKNNRNDNNSGNTEDIFEIMEKYRAKQARLDETPKSESKEPSQAVKPEAQKKAQPKKPAFALLPALKSLKNKFSELFKKQSNTEKKATHGKRPADEAVPKREAKINNKAMVTHFSDNEPTEVEAVTVPVDTSLNIKTHLSDTTPELEAISTENSEGVNTETVTEEKPKNKFVKWLKITGKALSNMSFIAKASVYITIVCILAAFASYYAITIANDVFAFVKPEREVVVDVPENATDKEIAYLLKKNDLIEYSWMFELYLIYKTDEGEQTVYIPGEKTLSSSMNYNQFIAALTTETVVNEQVSVTIPEGFTVDQIIDLLTSKGIGTREGFVNAINNYPFKHEFVLELDKNGYPEARKYRLEGYLYPDTYFFYKTSEEYVVINKMLNNFESRFYSQLDEFKDDIDKLGMTVDDIVTLASMIQAEGKYFIDFEPISYVFHNRLSHSNTFPYLQSDATIQYVLSEHVDDFTQEQLDLDNPYNTYKYKGLPPGAICNPGYDALSSAVYPDSPVDSDGKSINAYYFVSNKAGKTYYAETKAQHDANKRLVKKENEALND